MNVVYESDQQKGSYSVLLHIVWVILLVEAPLRGARSARKSFRSCFFFFPYSFELAILGYDAGIAKIEATNVRKVFHLLMYH